MSNAPFLPLLLTIIEAVGTLAFALSGLLEAARKRLNIADPVAYKRAQARLREQNLAGI